MLSSSGQSLFVDPKSNVAHYDGSPKLAEEYEERVWLGFQPVPKDDKVSYAAKLKNALFGRAWALCHRKPEAPPAQRGRGERQCRSQGSCSVGGEDGQSCM